MRSPKTVHALEQLGRVRLSDSFFMRDFLYSEISQIEGIPNIPENPDLLIEVGRQLCEKVLEPLQAQFGRISIRSAYRSAAVNAKGAENNNQYNCSRNEANYASHIWDYPDSNGDKGATACIVVNRFIPYFEQTGDWQALAWWIHDNIPEYADMSFFPKFAALNISWHQNPAKTIYSYIPGSKGYLTRPGMDNFNADHATKYQHMLENLGLNN